MSAEPLQILQNCRTLKRERGKLTQQNIRDSEICSYYRISKNFEGIREIRVLLKIASSNYTSYDLSNVSDIDIKSTMIRLLEKCEESNGKVTQDVINEDQNMPKYSDYRRIFGDLSMPKLRADIGSDQVVHLNDEQLEELESEMIAEMRRCKEKYGNVSTKKYRDMDTDVSLTHIKRHFDTFSKAKEVALDDPGITHLTDSELKQIDKDLENNERKKEILIGLLMGDATISKTVDGKRNNLEVEMANEQFLEWLSKQLGCLVSQFGQSRTVEQLAAKNRRHGHTVNEENISEEYIVSTVTTDFTTKLRDKWYPNGEKRFPDDLNLTPEITRMWYVCDGSLVKNEYAVIYANNEINRQDYMESLFDDTPFNPSFNYTGGGGLQFKKKETPEFLEWIGDPVPGYEYKWDIE